MSPSDNSNDLKKAYDYKRRAESASNSLKYEIASDLYFKAAHYFKEACKKGPCLGEDTSHGDHFWSVLNETIYPERYCSLWGWYCKANAVKSTTSEEYLEEAEYFEEAIRAANEGLLFTEAQFGTDERNMRVCEGRKYTCFANSEAKLAKSRSMEAWSSGTAMTKCIEIRVNHINRGANYKKSAALSWKKAADIDLKDNDMKNYYNSLGSYHQYLSESDFYLAWAHEELSEWKDAFAGYNQARKGTEKAISLTKKAIDLKSTMAYRNNLQQLENWLKNKLFPKIKKIRPKLEESKVDNDILVPDNGLIPNLDIHVELLDGMVENLVSTFTVELENTGSANAGNIEMELQSSFIEGETSASITDLVVGKSTKRGFAIIPNKAGRPNVNLHVSYEDPWGKNYRYESDTIIEVARREEERPPPATIINVKGDYIDDRDTIIQDSVVNRSNIGTGEKSKAEELREAKALLDDGIIDNDEFKQMKKEILGK